MKKSFLILSLFATLISNACAKDSSQILSFESSATNSDQIKNGENLDLVGEKKNAKYGLTALFYKDKQESSGFDDDKLFFNRLIIRQDKTNRESKPIEIRPGYGAAFRDVWSPNEDFLLLPGSLCGQNGFCVYKTSNIVERFAQNEIFQADKPSDFITLTFTDSQPESERGKVKPCQHFFVEWIGEASFVFAVKAYESKNGRSKFKYDLSQQKLFSGLEKKGLGDNGFNAANKNGKLTFAKE